MSDYRYAVQRGSGKRIAMEAWGSRHVRKTVPLETGKEYGFLTCLEQVSGGTYSRFRCRCGAEFMREHRIVRWAVADKRVPTCKAPACRKAALVARAELLAAAKEQAP